MRAAYEGVAYATRQNLENMQNIGITLEELKIVGGGAKSEIWNQIKADILEKRIVVEKAADASLIGSGILACCGAGWIRDLFNIKFGEYPQQVFVPRAKYKQRYTKMFQIYKKLYTEIKSSFRDIGELK